MVCNAACNLFLNNSEFRVKQILQPTSPFVGDLWCSWKTHALPEPPRESREHFSACFRAGGLFIFDKKVDLIFSKRFEKQQVPAPSLHM